MSSVLDGMKVTSIKPVKVKAFDSCEASGSLPPGRCHVLTGHVSRSEAILLERVLQLARRPALSLSPAELQLVGAMLALKGES